MPPHTIIFCWFFRNSFDFSTWISWPSTNSIAKKLVASFISKYSPTPIIIFVLDRPLNACMFLFLCHHWSIIGQSTLVAHSFSLTLNRPLGYIQSWAMEQFWGQFFWCCFVVLPNPLTTCYTVAGSNLTKSTFTWSVFSCTLLFNPRDIIFDSSKRSLCYRRYGSWRSIAVIPKM